MYGIGVGIHISIHAPVKGATWVLRVPARHDRHFNPRSREGSDSGLRVAPVSMTDFNPRSREGSDKRDTYSLTDKALFQSTLP